MVSHQTKQQLQPVEEKARNAVQVDAVKHRHCMQIDGHCMEINLETQKSPHEIPEMHNTGQNWTRVGNA